MKNRSLPGKSRGVGMYVCRLKKRTMCISLGLLPEPSPNRYSEWCTMAWNTRWLTINITRTSPPSSSSVIYTVERSQPVESLWEEVEPTWMCCLKYCRNKLASTEIPAEFFQALCVKYTLKNRNSYGDEMCQTPVPVRWTHGQYLHIISCCFLTLTPGFSFHLSFLSLIVCISLSQHNLGVFISLSHTHSLFINKALGKGRKMKETKI